MIEQQPFFSIIVPVYNIEQYIKECIESIINQDLNNIEIILVDDGSTDNSGKICDKYSQNDKRIKVIHKQNAGVSEARNSGIKKSKGKYIIFVDGDDFLIANILLELKEILLKNTDIDVLLSKRLYFYEKNNRIIDNNKSFDLEKFNSTEKKDILIYLLKFNLLEGHVGLKVVRRNLIFNNTLLFDRELSNNEDVDWTLSLFLNIENINIKATDIKFYVYRKNREGSASNCIKQKSIISIIKVLNKWYCFLEKENIDKELRKGLFNYLAFIYSNLFLGYSLLEECSKNKKLEIKKLIEAKKELLDYAQNKRTKIIGKLYKIFGFNITIRILKIIYKLKRG